MKHIFRYALLIFIFLGITRIASAQKLDWMPDVGLRQAVREKLNVPQQTPLTVLHLEDLHDLVVVASDIASLRGLEHAVNLHFLHLSDSRIADLTPLAQLFSLETLKLYGNRISDITPLAKLTALQKLELAGNRISDIAPLSNLTALVSLGLHDNQITDLTPLTHLTNLKELSIRGNPITDFSPLAKFPQFAHLVPTVIEIPDPTLERAVREKLGLPAGIPLTDVDMQRLYDLVIVESDIASLRGLEHAVNLRFLHASDGRIADLTPLANLGALTVLKLYDNAISDISPLANLTHLAELNLVGNRITDFTPLLGFSDLKVLQVYRNPGDLTPLLTLNLTGFQVCNVGGSRIAPRIANREYPSVFAAWANIVNLPTLTESERLARHDLYFCCPMFGLGFVETEAGIQLVGDIEGARQQRRELQTENPNMVLLVGIQYFSGVGNNEYSEAWPHWLKDKNGNRVIEPRWNEGLLDFTQPETQEWAIEHAIAVSKCGVFDGIFFDHWSEHPRLQGYRSVEEEHAARDTLLRRIRAAVPEDFLIMVNSNHEQIPRWAPYVNGLFMETRPGYTGEGGIYDGYTEADIVKIQETLLWAETALREPRINGLEGFGLRDELPDSPRNQQWMRFFTTMSLTHSDGYVLYAVGLDSLLHEHIWYNAFFPESHNERPHVHDHDHYWYDFWDADLGRPIGEKAQPYENREGLFIREFTNGWAVYNRSGQEQQIEFLEEVSGVASGMKDKRSHVLPDLDGEIYLKSESGVETAPTADVNGDGIVNILDLVVVANAFGETTPDINADGTVNILDLVVVANAFNN